MNIEKVKEKTKCNWCGEGAFPNEEMLVQSGVNLSLLSDELSPPAYYHLRCAGKLFVLRIEGVLPEKAFSAVVKELNTNIVEQSSEEEE